MLHGISLIFQRLSKIPLSSVQQKCDMAIASIALVFAVPAAMAGYHAALGLAPARRTG